MGLGFEVEFQLCHLTAKRPSASKGQLSCPGTWAISWGVCGGPVLAEGACVQAAFMSSPQGNGHERDFMGDKRVYIMDVYNRHIYPGDRFAKRKLPPLPQP